MTVSYLLFYLRDGDKGVSLCSHYIAASVIMAPVSKLTWVVVSRVADEPE